VKFTLKEHRAAMTLVEVAVVVAVSSIVMGVLVSLAIALFQRDRAIRSFAVESDRRSEMAELLRTDIRRATDVKLLSDNVLLVTLYNGTEVRYELAETNCKRTVSMPEGSKPRFDSFAVGKAVSWSLEPGPPGRRPLFIVTLNRATRTADASARPNPLLLVYAALSADLPAAVATISSE
jgi:hypothetical protein